mgnify:CR=1 FL=1
MNAYGEVAIRAIECLQSGACTSPIQAWDDAAAKVFSRSTASQEKSCPRSAFLGLCEDGLVSGVSRGNYTESTDNKRYALRALQLLRQDPEIARLGPESLWQRVMAGESKKSNS